MRLKFKCNLQLMADIFERKTRCKSDHKIEEQREVHRPDWPGPWSVAGELKEFDFYFDFVLAQGNTRII